MNTVNASTGFSPFILKMGCSPQLLPPLLKDLSDINDTAEGLSAQTLIESIENNVCSARNSMLAAKISQVHHANKDRLPEPLFNIGDHVMLATAKHWREYMQAKDGCMAKFMARYDGPYKILEAYPDSLTYKLLLPTASKQTPLFHVSQL